jgi:type IV secretion system protein VirB2
MKQSHLLRAAIVAAAFLPQLALAQATGGLGGAGDGVTGMLRSVASFLVGDWAYVIGVIALAVQGYRWQAGHITMIDFGKWGLGVALVFFAPKIVSEIRMAAGGGIV